RRAGAGSQEAGRTGTRGSHQVREEVRDVWLTRWLRDFVYDLRFSVRSFCAARHSAPPSWLRLRSASEHRTGLRVLHRRPAFPSARRSSIAAQRGAVVPNGWKIASGLDETAAPTVFTAPEYDTLVDQPTLMGQFDATRFMVDGKPHDFVAHPAG